MGGLAQENYLESAFIGFLNQGKAWGNNFEGSEWIEAQKNNN